MEITVKIDNDIFNLKYNIMNNNYSVNTHDEALNFLVSKFLIGSKEVNTFLYLGRTDNAIDHARELGYDIDED